MDKADLAYVQGLIGTPWQRRGHHCWWLVADIQERLFGRTIPFADAPTVPRTELRRELLSQPAEAYGWREIPAPVHGAVVRMHSAGGNPANLEHAGVWLDLDGGGCLHTDNPHGVVFDTLLDLSRRGWVPRFFIPMED